MTRPKDVLHPRLAGADLPEAQIAAGIGTDTAVAVQAAPAAGRRLRVLGLFGGTSDKDSTIVFTSTGSPTLTLYAKSGQSAGFMLPAGIPLIEANGATVTVTSDGGAETAANLITVEEDV